MVVESVYYCITCREIFKPNHRAIEGKKLKSFLNGEVTREKINMIRSINLALKELMSEWFYDYYSLASHYDLSSLIEFLSRHKGHQVIITDDQEIEWIADINDKEVDEY